MEDHPVRGALCAREHVCHPEGEARPCQAWPKRGALQAAPALPGQDTGLKSPPCTPKVGGGPYSFSEPNPNVKAPGTISADL